MSTLIDILESFSSSLPFTWPIKRTFEESYPTVHRWTRKYGWIEIGPSEPYTSVLRAFNPDGLVWESGSQTTSVDRNLKLLDEYLEKWIGWNYGTDNDP